MLSLNDFDYYLPEKLIAQQPVEQRDQSRLMVLDRAHRTVSHHRFSDIETLLGPSDLLVVNNTKVFPARLLGRKETGGKAEVLLLGYPAANNNGNSFTCECLIKASKRPGEGTAIIFDDSLYGEVDAINNGRAHITLHCNGDFDSILHRLGRMPLPPYIKRDDEAPSSRDDRERYQTVYADKTGAVAAPTAGLHFSDDLISKLKAKGIEFASITLHVGYGTFMPVRVTDIRDHRMHSEWYEISEDADKKINNATKNGKRIIAVGTTSVRALEYATDETGFVCPGAGECDLFITPGYKFKVVQAMITNFHLPRSTLIMLVSAFAGREFLLDAYQAAVQSEYRFYSYGDGMLIV
ncbi:MAG: tRNA preQ1(34) S-adenosylmethionine ribosyltransferase-isomerase QueA [Pseudomonadota bacterium]